MARTVPALSPSLSLPPAPTLGEIAGWVRARLGDGFPPDTNGVWQVGDGRAMRCLGVAVAGSAEVAARASAAQVDGVLLHRPWGLGPLPPGVGVLAFHEALDARLTVGENPWLAAHLGFTLGARIGAQQGQPLLCLAHASEGLTMEVLLARLGADFPRGELWNARPARQIVHTIALARAMRPALVAIAASQGAALYLTDSLRRAACPLLMQSEMAALGLGHAALERWGLRWLVAALQSEFGIGILWL